MQLTYHPEAETELIEAARFYEACVPSLGGQFLDALEVAVGKIVEDPLRWRLIERDIRRALMLRFPFGIYYRIHPGQVRILAVKHHSRHPDSWRRRTTE